MKHLQLVLSCLQPERREGCACPDVEKTRFPRACLREAGSDSPRNDDVFDGYRFAKEQKRAGISLPSPSKVVVENRELTYFEKLATASASVL